MATGELQSKILRAPTHFVLPSPVFVNVGQTTYARVLYSNDGIAALVTRMASLSSADQIGRASIRQNRHIAQHAVPEMARWISAQRTQ